MLEEFLTALIDRSPPHILEHLYLVVVAVSMAVIISFPLSVVLTREKFYHLSGKFLGLFNIGQTVPPLAVISIFLPFLGVGTGPALLALTIYALLPIARNTIAGLMKVPQEMKEAARGMGMNNWEVFFQVEIPFSLPVILTGLKTSVVLTIGTATLASLVGAGGMGAVLFAGIDFFQSELILAGTFVLALMAICFERMITLVEWLVLPRHMR